MRRLFLQWVPWCCLAALFHAPAWAVGLGDLTVHSHLNEPFHGEVALLDAETLEVNELRVALASEEAFARLGVERVFFLTQLRFEVQTDGAEKHVLLTTEAPLREPYLDFVMALHWPQGRLLRDYTALIDLPPSATAGLPSTNPSGPEGVGRPAEEAPQRDPIMGGLIGETPESGSQLAVTDGATTPIAGAFYFVVPKDTLWRIASSVASDAVSVEQVMLEIIRMNPEAFQEQNVNGLKAGYRLQLPLAADIAMDNVTAIDEVALQNNAWRTKDSAERAGLTLIADEVTAAGGSDSDLANAAAAADEAALSVVEPVVASRPVADEQRVLLPDTDDRQSLDPVLTAPEQLEPAVIAVGGDVEDLGQRRSGAIGASRGDLEALTMTVGRLQSTLAELQEQIAQRDAELVSLKAVLALRDERLQAAVTALAMRNETSPQGRLVDAATSPAALLGAILCLVLSLGWFYRRQRAVPADAPAQPARYQSDQAKATAVDDSNSEIDSTVKPHEGVSNAAAELPAGGEGSGDPISDVGSPAEVSPSADNDSALTTSERTTPDTVSPLEGEPAAEAEASESMARDRLSLAPKGTLTLESQAGDSIYGLETDPVDSQLDLARAYIDMGDEEGAYPVLTQVIAEGSLSQQAEARALLNRLDVS